MVAPLKKITVQFWFAFLGVAFITNTFSQTTIKGQISFKGNENNIPVSIVLKEAGTIIAYTISQENNFYEIQTSKTGTFELFFNSISFESQKIEVVVTSTNKTIEKNVTLIYKPIELNEVIIINDKPITVKKDTVIFNAKDFLIGNERVVEDLLKKIPGITVSADGIIKVGNQEVEKIMVEGDDMFEKGYKILTKNMPVKPIEKVELYQRYSNNKLLKGIENSQKVALNLKLKDDFKSQWFGNVDFSYGLVSEDRYDVRSNLMNFGKKYKYYFVTNLNNIGTDPVGDLNNIIRPNRNYEIGNFGDNQRTNNTIFLNGTTPALKPNKTNFNNAELVSLNSIFTISSKLKIKALGFFNSDEINFYRNSNSTFTVGNSSFNNIEDYNGKNNKTTFFNKLELIYEMSKTKTLEYTSKYSFSNQNNENTLNFNQEILNENLETKNNLVDQKFLFTNKLKENKVLILSGRLILENSPQDYTVNQFVYQDLFASNNNNLQQTSITKMQFYGAESSILERLKKGNLLEIKAGYQHKSDFLNSSLFLKDNQTITSQPIGYQNDLVYSTDNLYFKTKYSNKFKKVELFYQAAVFQLFNKLESEDNARFQNPFFINPRVDLIWEINQKNKIMTSINYSTTNANVLDVYNNYINTSFRSFTKGTGDFNQLNATEISINYNLGNYQDKFFSNFNLNYTVNHDFFSFNFIEAQNYVQSEKIVIKNLNNIAFSSDINRYFNVLKSNIKLKLDFSKSNFKNTVNNSDLREIDYFTANYGLEVRSSFKGIFNYHVGSTFTYNEVKTTFKNSFTNNTSFLNLFFTFNPKNVLQLQSERYVFGNVSKETNQYYFFDFDFRRVIIDNKFSVSLIGSNLFNVKTFNQTNISDTYIINNSFRLQPRYAMLRLEYSF